MVLRSTLNNERVGYLFYSYSRRHSLNRRRLAKLTATCLATSPLSGRGPHMLTLKPAPRVGSQHTLADRVSFVLSVNLVSPTKAKSIHSVIYFSISLFNLFFNQHFTGPVHPHLPWLFSALASCVRHHIGS